MIKKKAKGKQAKKSAKKSSSMKKQKELHPAEVRKDLSLMIEESAHEIAEAVIAEGKKGQIAAMKYLLESAKIFPAPPEGEQASAEEDSLAKTLLHRLNLPVEPIDLDNPPVLEQKLLGSADEASDQKLLTAGEEDAEDTEKN